jgi:hypothetical protein
LFADIAGADSGFRDLSTVNVYMDIVVANLAAEVG